ncbi:thioesterase family protein [Sphingobium boeckii]|uniref:4-hydroxybenzoyl-CoA thioesterase n=1 Tax=Sphingobium boeckii TaxID=1082345 RepID=A0A7W9EGN1_9SPHN|nr:4-hydroxybenzoyl-CoA thioesterase [Sphingobium boeckii]
MIAHYPVRFAHCDPAGIAYYPRLFELCDGAIEDWCALVLRVPRRIMHLELGLGMPTVHMEARFIAPCRLGEILDIEIAARRVGNSSIDLTVRVGCGGAPRFEVDYTQVLMTLTEARATPWPDAWRTIIESELTVRNDA